MNKGAGYTTEVKCVRGTQITFDVKPMSRYSIKSVTVKRGADKANSTNVPFTLLGTAEDGTAVYQISEAMQYSNNLFIDVEFEPDPELVTVYNTKVGYGNDRVRAYLFYVSDPEDIDLRADESTYVELSSETRFGADLKSKTSVYYVLTSDRSREELELISARYSEMSADDEGTDILDALNASATGLVLRNTAMSVQAAAPAGYRVQSVEAEMNGEGVTVTKSGDIYTIANKAPDSGTTTLTVKYSVNVSSYTLIYNYQGRQGGNSGSYIGDDAEYDPRTYTVNVELSASELNSLVQPDGEFVTAPESDGSNAFAYWSVAENGKETAKCYDREFNLRVTGDCTVTAEGG